MIAFALGALVGFTVVSFRAVLLVQRRAAAVARIGLGPPARRVTLDRFRSRLGRSEQARDRAMPELLEALARAVRGGSSVAQAVSDTPAPPALAADIGSLRRSLAHGVSAPEVFAEWRVAASSHSVRLGAAALELAASGGGAMARALDAVASSLRERQAIQGEIRALSSQAQASALVIAALPVGFAALAAVTEPRVLVFLVTTPVGGACLASGLVLEVAGGVWMRQITRSTPW